MAKLNPSIKQNLIDKANTTVVIVTSAACFIVVFSLVAAHTLLGQLGYQNRLISADKQTLTTLKQNLKAVGTLETSYDSFNGTAQNVLGGSPTGNGAQDGNNAQIVLDALPSAYDFPAMATSLDKLLTGQQVQIQSITGTDDEVAQDTGQSSGDPAPVPMPFQVTVTGNYQAVQNVIQEFNRSIRPIQIQTMTISGDQSNLTLTLTAQTFYQPQKSLNISTKVIK